MSESKQAKDKRLLFSREKKNFAVRRNETLSLDFCHSGILGHWFSSLKKLRVGSRVRQILIRDSNPGARSDLAGSGGGRAPPPCTTHSFTKATFDSVFGFEISYEILPPKGFYKEKKKKPLKIPSFQL